VNYFTYSSMNINII